MEAGKKGVHIKWKWLENAIDVNKRNDSLSQAESLEISGERKKRKEKYLHQGKKWTK